MRINVVDQAGVSVSLHQLATSFSGPTLCVPFVTLSLRGTWSDG